MPEKMTPVWLKRLALFGLWTALGLFFTSQVYVIYSDFLKSPITWGEALRTEMSVWYVWAALAPLVLLLGRRYRLERGQIPVNALRHAGAGVALAGVHIVATVTVIYLVETALTRDTAFSLEPYVQFFVTRYHWNLAIYWAILGVGHAVDYRRLYRERLLAAAHLETSLAEARLLALKAQVRPHFLFNTLNAIATLIYDDPERAVMCLARLSDLLRGSLDGAATREVPLDRELELLQHYFDIMQLRFGERLHVEHEIAPETRPALVPGLILQPLVENAVQYAVAPRSAGGRVTVRARRAGARLELEVADDGPGLVAAGVGKSHGVGLANVRARLEHLYGGAAGLALEPGPTGGLVARVAIPFRTAEQLEPAPPGTLAEKEADWRASAP